jgi:tetratricopeptide (TPR) repeat protein
MKPRVLLVGLEGAQRALISELMDEGALPHLQRIVESGCVGALAARAPHVRSMLWTTLATGREAPLHGVCGDVELRDDGGGVRPAGHASWRAPSMWQLLAQAGARSTVIAWPATAPATSWNDVTIVDPTFCEPLGASFDAWPLLPDCVAPASAREGLRSLRVHPADITGEQLQAFVPEASRIDQEADRRLLRIALALSRTATVHATATHLASDTEWDLCCVVYPWLADVSREFLRYRTGGADVPASEVTLYGGVVDAAVRFQDVMLGRLLDCAGDAATVLVVSTEGFLAARGPSAQRDALVHGASLVDIAPTVLNLFGARAEALQGRCIEAISPPLPPYRATTVFVAVEPRRDDPAEADDTLSPAQRGAIEHATLAWLANAAEADLATGRYAEAAAGFERVLARMPQDWRVRARLAQCDLHLGRHAECLALAAPLVEQRPDDPWGHLLCAAARVLSGDAAGAAPHLASARAHGATMPAVALRLGMLHLASRDWTAAETLFRDALLSMPDAVLAYDGLGCALHAQARYDEAIDAFRTGLGHTYHCAIAHAHLAMSLAAVNRWDEAAKAARVALAQDPGVPGVRQLLDRADARASRTAGP